MSNLDSVDSLMLKQLFVVLGRRIYKGIKLWSGVSQGCGLSFPCSDETEVT